MPVESPVAGSVTWALVTSGALAGHTCGVSTSGDAFCWGSNGDGQLGDGTPDTATVPTPVAGDESWSTVAVGASHTCGVISSGQGLCWGDNHAGELGDGTETSSSTPVAVVQR